MASHAEAWTGESRRALYAAAAASLYVAILMPVAAWPSVRASVLLLGAWFIIASLIRFIGMRDPTPIRLARPVPILFSGRLGRFWLLARGDGRRVEVRAGAEVVAEAIATDERDELVLRLEGVADSELDELGAAIGEAIGMVAVADADRPVQRP